MITRRGWRNWNIRRAHCGEVVVPADAKNFLSYFRSIGEIESLACPSNSQRFLGIRKCFNSGDQSGKALQKICKISCEIYTIEKIAIDSDRTLQSYYVMPPEAGYEEQFAWLQDTLECSCVPEKGKLIERRAVGINISIVKRVGIFRREEGAFLFADYLSEISMGV